MKKFIYYSLILMTAFMVGCTKDPLKFMEDANWSKERNLVALQLEGQIGTVILDRTSEHAIATVNAKFDQIEDLSKVKVVNIDLSYGATTPNGAGSTLDFTGTEAPSITVISQVGEELKWTVKMNEFKSDLEGTWYISEIGMFCDLFTWESWGWSKNVNMVDYLPLLKPEWDNVLTFTVEGADAKGNPYGKFTNEVGGDGKYGDFTGDGFSAISGSVDFNSRYRLVPKGEGTWKRDYELKKVILTDEYNKEFFFDLEINDDKTIALKAEVDYTPGNFDWNVQDYRYEELANMSKSMWYKITADKPVIPMSPDNYITAISVEGQSKDAAINNDNNEVVFTLDGTVADFTAIKLATLSTSALSTVDTQVGKIFDLSDDKTANITVTAENGTTRTYTLTAKDSSVEPAFSVDGTWNVIGLDVFVDFFSWESWGSSETKAVKDFLPAAAEEDDNKLTFAVTSSDATAGIDKGTYSFSSGADGKYTDFTIVSTSSKIPDPVDMNSRLRILPKADGTFTYTKNGERTGGTIEITSDGVVFQLIVEEHGDGSLVLKKDLEYNSGPFDWDQATVDYNYEKLYHLSKAMWYKFSK